MSGTVTSSSGTTAGEWTDASPSATVPSGFDLINPHWGSAFSLPDPLAANVADMTMPLAAWFSEIRVKDASSSKVSVRAKILERKVALSAARPMPFAWKVPYRLTNWKRTGTADTPWLQPTPAEESFTIQAYQTQSEVVTLGNLDTSPLGLVWESEPGAPYQSQEHQNLIVLEFIEHKAFPLTLTHTDPFQNDTDGDGLSDGIETTLGMSPLLTSSRGSGWGDHDLMTAAIMPAHDFDIVTKTVSYCWHPIYSNAWSSIRPELKVTVDRPQARKQTKITASSAMIKASIQRKPSFCR